VALDEAQQETLANRRTSTTKQLIESCQRERPVSGVVPSGEASSPGRERSACARRAKTPGRSWTSSTSPAFSTPSVNRRLLPQGQTDRRFSCWQRSVWAYRLFTAWMFEDAYSGIDAALARMKAIGVGSKEAVPNAPERRSRLCRHRHRRPARRGRPRGFRPSPGPLPRRGSIRRGPVWESFSP